MAICQQIWLVGDDENKWRWKSPDVIFHPSPQNPPLHRFLLIWFGGLSPGCNHILSISDQPVNRFWFYKGSNFAISHRKECLALTRCCTTMQSVISNRVYIYTIIWHVQETSEILPLSTVFLQPVKLVTACTLTMLGALEVVHAAYCAL